MKIIGLKYWITAFALIVLYSCVNSSEGGDSNAEPEITDPLEQDTLIEVTFDELPEFWMEKDISPEVEKLLEVFATTGVELSGDDYVDLGLDPEKDFMTRVVTEKVFELEHSTVFISSTYGMSTAVYDFTIFFISYFNVEGELESCQELMLINENLNYFVIQGDYLGFKMEYAEFVEGDYIMEETGNMVEEWKYFHCTAEHLVSIDDITLSKLPFLRNQIYARHGYIFKSKKYTDYFEKFKWYFPEHENVDELLSEQEKDLINYFVVLEKRAKN